MLEDRETGRAVKTRTVKTQAFIYNDFRLAPHQTNTSYVSMDGANEDHRKHTNKDYEARGDKTLLECFYFALMTANNRYRILESGDDLKNFVLREATTAGNSNGKLWILPKPAEMYDRKIRFVCALCKARRPNALQDLKAAKKHMRMHPIHPIALPEKELDEDEEDEVDEDEEDILADLEEIGRRNKWPYDVDWQAMRETFAGDVGPLIDYLVKAPEKGFSFQECVTLIQQDEDQWEQSAQHSFAHAGFYGPIGYKKILRWTKEYLKGHATGVHASQIRPLPSVDAYIRYVMVPAVVVGLIRLHLEDLDEEHDQDDGIRTWEESLEFGRAVRSSRGPVD
ncbi:hypothetical protein OC846_006542 [Tilletia horrida]|uniref:Restriction of telomere capping protein 4 C-terminal domain-containing protein n=1 Tax=Tilletia horrida TaxID=155126 RepID=A0AAN6JP97_9BASI|nr:hypothetical protein OC846_006542 [Tilletia horrida]